MRQSSDSGPLDMFGHHWHFIHFVRPSIVKPYLDWLIGLCMFAANVRYIVGIL